MKIKLLIGFIIALQVADISAVDGCCDHRNLESTAVRYALCIEDSKEINPSGINKDLQFLSPEAITNPNFKKYMQTDSFEVIAKYAITKPQQQAVNIFRLEFKSAKTEDLLKKAQLCMLLDKIIIKLRPSINIDLSANPVLKSLADSPSFNLSKMLLPSLVEEPK